MKPQYQHDCKYCEFVGIIDGKDIYVCPQNGYPTIVAREGRKREEYMSGQRLTLGSITLTLNQNIYLR